MSRFRGPVRRRLRSDFTILALGALLATPASAQIEAPRMPLAPATGSAVVEGPIRADAVATCERRVRSVAEVDGAPADAGAAERAGRGDFDASGKIPCAQVRGQPMGQCDFAVARGPGGEATVVVTRPDGTTRALVFEGGAFVGADTSRADGDPAYSAAKEAHLFVIRVGDERYEIPEAVVVGG